MILRDTPPHIHSIITHSGSGFAVLLISMLIQAGCLLLPATVFNVQPTPPFDAKVRLDKPYFSCFLLGDWGMGNQRQKGVANGMTKKMQKDSAMACFLLGDNFYMTGVESVLDPQWESKFERVYPPSIFPVLFYAILGNHDYWGSTRAQINYSNTIMEGKIHTRWRMPSYYWTETFPIRDTTQLRVIGIDAQGILDHAQHSNNQIAWLDSVLSVAKEKWVVVLGHNPIFSGGWHGESSMLKQLVLPLLEKHHVDFYIAGHDHNLQMLKPVHGVNHLVVGNGGAVPYSVKWDDAILYATVEPGFAWMQFGENNALVQFIDSTGTVLFAKIYEKPYTQK